VLAVPPLGSADLGSYAAYGRIAALGYDPYLTTPNDLPGDPVTGAAEDPWRDQRSVYGPFATGVQALVAHLGGESRATVLRGLAVVAGLAFLAAGWLLDRVLRGDAAARRRAALLWTANPLLIVQLVAAAHLDGLVALAVLAAVAAALRGRALFTGLLLGAAGGLKVSAIVPAAGLAVAGRRRLPAITAGGLLVIVPGYLAVGGLRALEPAREQSRSVSFGSPWRLVVSWLDDLAGRDASRLLVTLAALAGAAALAVLLSRRLPAGPAPARAALATTLAWLLVAPYALPWYDALGWVLLGLVAASGYDRLLTAHTAMLSLAYLPGRLVDLPPGLAGTCTVVRSGITPVVLLGLLVLAIRRPLATPGPAVPATPGR
jgi:alpha-1,6-mannosyltransferase